MASTSHLLSVCQVCDVISQWEQAFLHHATQRSGKVDLNRTVRFTYKNRLYFKSQTAEETPKERFDVVVLCFKQLSAALQLVEVH